MCYHPYLFDDDIIRSKKVSPHIGLLLTFHRLYEEASQSINDINKRHLNYYYNEILQINHKLKKIEEDLVFVEERYKEKKKEFEQSQSNLA